MGADLCGRGSGFVPSWEQICAVMGAVPLGDFVALNLALNGA